MGAQTERLLVGAKVLPDGRMDTSHALFLYPDHPQFGQENPPIPPYWTLLIHGTHTGRHRGNLALLQKPVYVIDRKASGMSCLTAAQRDAQIRQGYDTIAGYGTPNGKSETRVEIATLFPKLQPNQPFFDEAKRSFTQSYGQAEADRLTDLAEKVYRRNEQVGSHPLLPRGTVLIKLADRTQDGVRQVFYVPQQLYEIYQEELRRQMESSL